MRRHRSDGQDPLDRTYVAADYQAPEGHRRALSAAGTCTIPASHLLRQNFLENVTDHSRGRPGVPTRATAGLSPALVHVEVPGVQATVAAPSCSQ